MKFLTPLFEFCVYQLCDRVAPFRSQAQGRKPSDELSAKHCGDWSPTPLERLLFAGVPIAKSGRSKLEC